MPILIECDCGKSYRVKDDLAGRKIRCPGCGDPVSVPQTREDDIVDAEVDPDSPQESVSERPKSSKSSERSRDLDPPKRANLRAPEEPPSVQKKPKKRRRSVVRGDDDDEGFWANFPLVVHPMILGGVLMILFGLTWLLVGLANGRYYLYSPVPIILGVVGIIRGFTGWD